MHTSAIKAAKSGYIVMSLLFCALGLLMILKPSFSAAVLSKVCGVCLILFGIVKIVGYFSKDLFRLAFQYDLASGIFTIILGAAVLMRPDGVMNFICIVLGIYTIADGLLKIQTAVDAKKFGIRKWWLILIFSVLTALCGVLLVAFCGEGSSILTAALGVAIFAEGVLSLITVVTAVKIVKDVKNKFNDVIDI